MPKVDIKTAKDPDGRISQISLDKLTCEVFYDSEGFPRQIHANRFLGVHEKLLLLTLIDRMKASGTSVSRGNLLAEDNTAISGGDSISYNTLKTLTIYNVKAENPINELVVKNLSPDGVCGSSLQITVETVVPDIAEFIEYTSAFVSTTDGETYLIALSRDYYGEKVVVRVKGKSDGLGVDDAKNSTCKIYGKYTETVTYK